MTDKSRNSDTFILKARKDKGVAAGRGGEGRGGGIWTGVYVLRRKSVRRPGRIFIRPTRFLFNLNTIIQLLNNCVTCHTYCYSVLKKRMRVTNTAIAVTK